MLFFCVEILLLTGQSLGAPPDSSDLLKSELVREDRLPCVTGEGTINQAGPTGENASAGAKFLLAADGRIRFEETNEYGTTLYWKDESAQYEMSGNHMEIYDLDSSTGPYSYVESMFFPAARVLSPLLERSQDSKLMSMVDDEKSGERRYVYAIEESNGTESVLTLVFGSSEELLRIGVRSGPNGFNEVVHQFYEHVAVGNNIYVPKRYRIFLKKGGIDGAEIDQTSDVREIVEIVLTSVDLCQVPSEIALEVKRPSKTTDYRKGVAYIKKRAGEVFESFFGN